MRVSNLHSARPRATYILPVLSVACAIHGGMLRGASAVDCRGDQVRPVVLTLAQQAL